jgi:hypothetical protein
MKYFLVISLFFQLNLTFSQVKICFKDKDSKKPIYFVQVFDAKNELIGISDLNGQIIFENKNMHTFKTKHLDYLSSKIDVLKDTIFYLKPKEQQLNEVIVEPIKSKSFYEILLEKTSKKVRKENFSGVVEYKGTDYYLILDSIRFNYDTISISFKFEIAFNFIFDKKNIHQSYKILKSERTLFAGKYYSEYCLNNRAFFSYHVPIIRFFERDMINVRDYERYSKKRGTKISIKNDSIPFIKILKEEENNNLNLKIFYNENDSIISSINYTSETIKNNSISYYKYYNSTFGVLNNVFYHQNYNHEFYGKIACVVANVNVIQLNKGSIFDEDFVDLDDLENQIMNLKPKIEAKKNLIFPNKYYELFKDE